MSFRRAATDHVRAAKGSPLSVAVHGVLTTSTEEGFDVNNGAPDPHRH